MKKKIHAPWERGGSTRRASLINLMGINLTGATFSRHNVEESRQPPSVILICAAASTMSDERKMVPRSIIKDGSHRLRPGILRREKTSIIQNRARLLTSIDPSRRENTSGIIKTQICKTRRGWRSGGGEGGRGLALAMTRLSQTRIQATYLGMDIPRKATRVIASSLCPGLPRFVPDALARGREKERGILPFKEMRNSCRRTRFPRTVG